MIIPSKELLSEVLDAELFIEHLWNIDKNNGLLYYTEANGGGIRINIHELAHKCKEWVSDKVHQVISKIYTPTDKCCDKLYICIIIVGDDYCKDFQADTEHEAIFKACQWVLGNRGK